MGYLGSTLLLVFNLAMVMFPDTFFISDDMEAMRISFVTVGVWWISFSHITYYYLPKGTRNNVKMTNDFIFKGFRELKLVWHQLKENLALKRYLYSYFVFIMAVQTVMLVATYFGATEVQWETPSQKTTGLIISILLIQLVAVLGAFLTSRASEKYGNIKTLIFLCSFWALLCCFAYFITLPIHFYATAGFVS